MQEPSAIPTKSSLSKHKIRLVELMQRINFGRIEGLVVRNGEPVLAPPPRVIREIRFGGENGTRPEAAKENFALKSQVVELLNLIEAIRDGVIQRLEIKHGLPFMMTIEEDAA